MLDCRHVHGHGGGCPLVNKVSCKGYEGLFRGWEGVDLGGHAETEVLVECCLVEA